MILVWPRYRTLTTRHYFHNTEGMSNRNYEHFRRFLKNSQSTGLAGKFLYFGKKVKIVSLKRCVLHHSSDFVQSSPVCPITVVLLAFLFGISCHGCPVLVVLCVLSCPVPAVLFWLTCSGGYSRILLRHLCL